jgi:hypothetical protein
MGGMDMIETKEEFIERYNKMDCHHDYDPSIMVIMPCDCEEGGGPTHWAALYRIPSMIRHHLEFNAPVGTPWPEEMKEQS